MRRQPARPHAAAAPSRGFGLIELMIAVAIVGILLAVALPAYNASIRKSRRSEAFTALAAIQQAQERWRTNNQTYGQLTDLGLSATTPSGYYTLSVVAADGASYTLSASAVSGTTQANDTGCTLLAVNLSNGSVTYGSGSSSTPLADANNCWVH